MGLLLLFPVLKVGNGYVSLDCANAFCCRLSTVSKEVDCRGNKFHSLLSGFLLGLRCFHFLCGASWVFRWNTFPLENINLPALKHSTLLNVSSKTFDRSQGGRLCGPRGFLPACRPWAPWKGLNKQITHCWFTALSSWLSWQILGLKKQPCVRGVGKAGLFSLADKDQQMPCVPLTNPYTSGWVTATLGEETF